jgi:hypothetical protein
MAAAMATEPLLLTLVLVGVVLYALNAIAARDIALAAAESACREAGVQLLDRGVALERARPRRNADGRVCLYRRYAFEFTSDGSRRYRGQVELLAGRVLHVELEPYRLQDLL